MAEDKFVFYVTLPTLEEMAACAVSRALWYSFMSRCKLKRTLPAAYDRMAQAFNIDHDYWDETDKDVESLKTPPIVEKLLKETVARVRLNLWKLVHHFSYELFFDDLERFNIGHVDFGYTKPDFCVWLPNGEIDYQKTAVNMLSLPGISNIHKFALMCRYYMKDRILEFPLDSQLEKFLEEVYFLAGPSLKYWIHFKKNKVHKKAAAAVRFTTLEAVLNCKDDDLKFRPVFEYFWHCLTDDKQYTVVDIRFTCMINYCNYKGYERIFSLLSASQQRRLLSKEPAAVLFKFSYAMNSPRSTLWAWMNCKDSLNGEQFSEVMSNLLFETKEERIRLFLDVWNTASDQQRNYVAQNVTDRFIKQFCFNNDPPSSAFSLLRQFLTMKDADFRKQLILQHAPKFGSSMNDAGTMNDILNLCLPASEDQSKFKNLVADSESLAESCKELIFRGDFDKLDVRLKFYLPDENARRKFKEILLDSVRLEDFIFNMKKWTGLSRLIDDALPNGPLALKKKKLLILQFVCKFPHHNPNGNRQDHMPTMFRIVESIFTNNALESMKQTSFESFLKKITEIDDHFVWRNYFHENYFLQFVRWVVGNDTKSIIKYQNGKLVDTVFQIVFQMLNKIYTEESYLFMESLVLDMEKCLVWYAANEQELMEYKMDKLKMYREFDIFESLWRRQDPNLDLLLKFFFRDDEIEMQNFKNTMFKT